jgi:hypothetical protein
MKTNDQRRLGAWNQNTHAVVNEVLCVCATCTSEGLHVVPPPVCIWRQSRLAGAEQMRQRRNEGRGPKGESSIYLSQQAKAAAGSTSSSRWMTEARGLPPKVRTTKRKRDASASESEWLDLFSCLCFTLPALSINFFFPYSVCLSVCTCHNDSPSCFPFSPPPNPAITHHTAQTTQASGTSPPPVSPGAKNGPPLRSWSLLRPREKGGGRAERPRRRCVCMCIYVYVWCV